MKMTFLDADNCKFYECGSGFLNLKKDDKEYKQVQIWMMKSVDAEIYFDNLASYKTYDVYEPVTGEDSPELNVDKDAK